jgi:hypothetical protein
METKMESKYPGYDDMHEYTLGYEDGLSLQGSRTIEDQVQQQAYDRGLWEGMKAPVD